MENKQVEELLNNMLCKEQGELSLEELDEITGGARPKSVGTPGLKAAKERGMTMNEVLETLQGYFASVSSLYPNVTIGEIEKFIKDNWGNP